MIESNFQKKECMMIARRASTAPSWLMSMSSLAWKRSLQTPTKLRMSKETTTLGLAHVISSSSERHETSLTWMDTRMTTSEISLRMTWLTKKKN